MIQTRQDSQRGCGWRKPGGLYLISGGIGMPCGLLPIPLEKCPTCSCGIKPTRGWTWVDVQGLTDGKDCSASPDHCASCPLGFRHFGNDIQIGKKQGLLWIGGKFYAKPEAWTDEAIKQGVSRRISAIPKDFKLGETWVLVAHREVSRKPCPDCREYEMPITEAIVGRTLTHKPRIYTGETIMLDGQPACKTCKNDGTVPQAAIFHAFKPSAIEYVVKGTETEEELEKMIKRGITPVRIERIDQQGNLLEGPAEAEVEEDLTEVETV